MVGFHDRTFLLSARESKGPWLVSAQLLRRRLASATSPAYPAGMTSLLQPLPARAPASLPDPARAAPKISFVSLGCPKALVDSERIVTRLRSEGYELAKTHAGADAVIVNTCGFLDSAKAESLAAIRAGLDQNGKVIVTGCMGAQPDAIRDGLPGCARDQRTAAARKRHDVPCMRRRAAPGHDPFVDLLPDIGVKLTPRHYAYLKISEGCNNSCTFCIIPQLRGRLVSRPMG